jgi:Flp pilus assembly protein TadD
MRRDLAVCLFLIVATLAVYGQVVRHDFVGFDDDDYVYENQYVRNGVNWEGVVWAFTTMKESNWHPLTWLSHMLDCQFFGLNAGYHHLTNVLLHLLNSLLLYMILRGMTGAVWRSGMVAALFALHPLHVESVAWVSERKDVLSTLFFMLTLWAYERYAVHPSWLRYGRVFVLLALGLMAKPMLVTLPFVLFLLDYWPLGRFQSRSEAEWRGLKGTPLRENGSREVSIHRLIVEKVPLLALVAASSVVTYVAQQRGGSMSSTDIVPLIIRIANALVAYFAYIGNMLWPSRLAVFYPYRDTLPTAQWMGAALALGFVSVFIVWAGQRRRYLTTGWLWYLGTLIPVIGLVQVGQQSMADRYTYVPLIGLFIIAAWGMADLAAAWQRGRIALVTSAGMVIFGCMVASGLQVAHWKNGVLLFEYALRVTRPNALVHDHLGIALMGQGKLDEAIPHFKEALRINPQDAYAHGNLGIALMEQDKLDEALPHAKEAIRINPQDAYWHYTLGILLVRQGKQDEALARYREAVKIDPAHAQAHHNLGIALARQGNLEEATEHFRKVLRLHPGSSESHASLALALASQGEIEEAMDHYREAIRLKPDEPRPYNNLAWLRATDPNAGFRSGTEAVRLAERACELSGVRDPNLLDTLAAAYAEAGRFPEAVATVEEAISLAVSVGPRGLVPELERRLEGYRGGRPYREDDALHEDGER